MSDSNTLSGSGSTAPHSVPELAQIAAAERELKRRGRRRLIGAGTLGLLGVIFLPMFFDTEPRGDKKQSGNSGNSKEITITIPQREGLSPLPPPAAALSSPNTSNSLAKSVEQAAVGKAETVEPKTSGAAVALGAAAVGAAVVGAAAVANSSAANEKNATKPEVVQSKPAVVSVAPPTAKVVPPPAIVSAPALKPAQVAVAKPEVKPEAKAAAKPESKPVPAPVVAAPVVATAAPATPTNPTAGGFVVQLGAFSDDYNIRTLTERMKAGKLPVYAEKIQITSAGKPKTVTRLRVGPYPTMERAKQISAKVKALGVTNTVVAK